MRLRAILDDREAVARRDRADRRHRRRMAVQVHRDDRGRRRAVAAASASGSMQRVAGSTSTKTGLAPTASIASAVAANVIATVITSSPGLVPSAIRARRSASVPDATVIACRAPASAANSASNAATSGPRMKVPRSSTRATAPWISRRRARKRRRGSACGICGNSLSFIPPKSRISGASVNDRDLPRMPSCWKQAEAQHRSGDERRQGWSDDGPPILPEGTFRRGAVARDRIRAGRRSAAATDPAEPAQRHRARLRLGLAHHPDAEGLAADAVPATVQTTEAAIPRYEQVVAEGGWPMVPPTDRLRLGNRATRRLSPLRQRLIARGDLDPSAVENDVYDSYVEAAVRRFQARHGLSGDGVRADAHLQRAEHSGRAAAGPAQDQSGAPAQLRHQARRRRFVMCNIPAAQHRGDRERHRGVAPHRGGRQAGPAVARINTGSSRSISIRTGPCRSRS